MATTLDAVARMQALGSTAAWCVATAGGDRLELWGDGSVNVPPTAGCWPALRYEGRLSAGRMRSAVRVELELSAWDDDWSELGLRHCGRHWPASGYFRAGERLLDELASHLADNVDIGAVLRFLQTRVPRLTT